MGIMKKHRLLPIFFPLLCLAGCTESASVPPGSTLPVDSGSPETADAGPSQACLDRRAALDTALELERIRTTGPGAVAAVRTPDCDPWEGASGTSIPGEDLTPNHLFWVGSVTKTFVSATV